MDKDASLLSDRQYAVYLNHCGVSPLCAPAVHAQQEFNQGHAEYGALLFRHYGAIFEEFHKSAAELLRTSPQNISFVASTAMGLNFVANGYPIEPGDEIISYIHEYPSNHYPWVLQEKRGAKLVLLSDVDVLGSFPASTRPRGWLMDELKRAVTSRTRIIALSHVQFTSGFAADLCEVGEFARACGIDLVVDAAQSLGALPVYPEEWGISALASSGWKWLLGPIGSGILYTSPELREKLGHTFVGPGLMKQGDDFLDHSWDPHSDGRRFEFSTLSYSVVFGLTEAIKNPFLNHSPEEIRAEIFRLQDLCVELLDRSKYTPVVFPAKHRSGILSLVTKGDPVILSQSLMSQGMVMTSRGGYLRVAPHFYNTDDEIVSATTSLNSL